MTGTTGNDSVTSKVRLVRMWYRTHAHVEKLTEWEKPARCG